MVAPSPPSQGGLEGLLRGQAALLPPRVGRGIRDLVSPLPARCPGSSRRCGSPAAGALESRPPRGAAPGGGGGRRLQKSPRPPPPPRPVPLSGGVRRPGTPRGGGCPRPRSRAGAAERGERRAGGGRGDSPRRGRWAPGSCIFMSVMSEGEHGAR